MGPRRVLITGANGFIGKNLTSELNKSPEIFDTYITDCFLDQVTSNKSLVADINSRELSNFILELQPDIVYHLAAQTNVRTSIESPAHDYEINVTGTSSILSAILGSPQTKIVFANSGGAIFGETQYPVSESATRVPLSPYGVDKLIASELIKFSFKLQNHRYAILNLANVYGREIPAKSAPAIFTKKIRDGETIEIMGDGEAARDWVHIDDVIQAFIAAGRSDKFGEFNISTGKETTINRLIGMIESKSGQSANVSYQEAIEGEIKKSILDPKNANSYLAWRAAISIENGIEDLVSYFSSTQ